MEKRLCIKISAKDNVAVAIYDLAKGTEVMPGVVTAVDIPQAHKIALTEMKKGDPVYRYGVLLGHVSEDIPLGGWINEKNLVMAPAPDLDSLKFMQNIVTDLPKPERTTWMGYRNPLKEAVEACDEQAVRRAGALCPAGTRNILAINTTVQCVTGVLNVAIRRIKSEILPKYPNVDDVIAVNHPYGCGVAIDAPEAKVPQRIIRNIAMHPNFGVQYIAERCVNEEVGKRLVEEMRWYDNYLRAGGVDRGANTTPGNKKGGLSNIIEKSMGSIAKSGSSPIVEVLSPGERPTKHGEIFAATPASDIVCGPSQLASGIGLQVFMTGRGTPYGLAAAPVVKLCSRNEMKEQWPDIIDFNAGPAAVGDKTIAEQGEELYNYILDIASGIKKPYTEQYGFANDLCIFNPAPIT